MDKGVLETEEPESCLLLDGSSLKVIELHQPGRFGRRTLAYFQDHWWPAEIIMATENAATHAICKNASMCGKPGSPVFLSDVEAHFWCVDGRYIQILQEYPGCRRLSSNDVTSSVLSGSMFHKLLTDLLQSLAHLHAMGFIHAGISPETLVTDGNSFSLSQFYFVHDIHGMPFCSDLAEFYPGCLGVDAIMFCAPELYLAGHPSVSSDVYSLGCSLFYLLTGEHSIKRDTTQDYREYFSQIIDSKCSQLDEQCKAAMALMLVEMAGHRADLSFLLEILSPRNSISI